MKFQVKELLGRIGTQVKDLFSGKGAQEEKGQTLIEYALIILLISIVVIIVLGNLGDQIIAVFNEIIDTFTTALGS